MPSLPPRAGQVFTREASVPAYALVASLSEAEESIFYLVSGCAAREDASGKTLSVAWPGELICHPEETRALAPSRVLVATRAVMERAEQTDPEFAFWAGDLTKARNHELHQRIEWFVNRRAEERILSVLMAQTTRAVTTTGSAAIPLAQVQVAQLAGATRETASMLLHRLRENGLIDYRRRWIEVPEPARLQAYVESTLSSAAS